jgi:hypothetical protein
MKVILSRKGFDSSYGGRPSPILPNGKMISFPIPVGNIRRYSDLRLNVNETYYNLIQQLGITTINEQSFCHVDPDIYREILDRPKGWKPAFGQVDAAELHLRNQSIGEGDLFLFFGKFCNTQCVQGKYIYYPNKNQDFHALFGYLQIGEILRGNKLSSWPGKHPHTEEEYLLKNPTNTIYVARDRLSWNSSIPGAGTFNFKEELRFTRQGTRRISEWDLPRSIFGNVKISYHPDPWRDSYFQSAAHPGQEFVIRDDTQDNTNVVGWAKEKIRIGISNNQ